jgi:urate oxidase / 2-oxo-4-hydroxy-4-carboxy-5-ureidoimidazoline decarboxylase
MRLETHYGKAEVSTYRTAASALTGVTRIPESAFTGRPNHVLAAEIDVQVLGEAFTAAYTQGDNSMVVATDSMKNFIHRESLAFEGSTLEGWLYYLGGRFLETYPQMERLRVSGEEIRFDPARVPLDGGGFGESSVLFHRRHDDRGVAALEVGRADDGSIVMGDLRAGRVGLDLLKTTGSAFADFPRDEYTTLPSKKDRLLFTHMDIAWRYVDPEVAVRPEPAGYVHPDQVADLAAVVFDQFVSLSIQHLVHEIGQRMFERFGALVEVSFEAQNRTFDLAESSTADEPSKVYTDPRPPYGRIGLTMRRDD